jgi:hypothetical protein
VIEFRQAAQYTIAASPQQEDQMDDTKNLPDPRYPGHDQETFEKDYSRKPRRRQGSKDDLDTEPVPGYGSPDTF